MGTWSTLLRSKPIEGVWRLSSAVVVEMPVVAVVAVTSRRLELSCGMEGTSEGTAMDDSRAAEAGA